ncbi:hypothetical protein LCGC14_1833890 [marine sediment metagenome]|uniref:Uncharacterized protein n=1 Tax=marine sediment metagenome TaxID=412755 RepID=A0A0F9H3H0_9ZZZZ
MNSVEVRNLLQRIKGTRFSKPQDSIGILIATMVAIVAGVGLIPAIVTSIEGSGEVEIVEVEQVVQEVGALTVTSYELEIEEESVGLSGLLGVLPYVFVVVVVLGVAFWLLPSKEGSRVEGPKEGQLTSIRELVNRPFIGLGRIIRRISKGG